MEDLSSLEGGPPLRDERFSPVSPISSPYGTYDPSRPIASQDAVSPLASSTRSISGSISGSISSLRFPIEDGIPQFPTMPTTDQTRIVPLRNSRSQSALRGAADIPPRPASADNNTGPGPFWLLVNGRLVWVEDMKLWVLWDEFEAAKAYEKKGGGKHQAISRNAPQHRAAAAAAAVGGRGGHHHNPQWKSLPPLPHEIHHLLPAPMESLSPDNSNAWQRPRGQRRYSQSSQSNSRLEVQWASLAGQLAPRTTTTHSQNDPPPPPPPPPRVTQFVDNTNQLPPRSLQPGYPTQPLHQPVRHPQPDSRLYYYY